MIYAHLPCPRDGLAGQLEFHYCPRSKKVFLICDECLSIWLDPQNMDRRQIDPPYLDVETLGWPESPGDVFINDIGCSYNDTREATEEEIIQFGWVEYIR